MTKIGINGFGRIGRLVFRGIAEQGLLGKEIEVVAVNEFVPADNLAYLVKYDSVQGKFTDTVSSEKSDPALGEDDTLGHGWPEDQMPRRARRPRRAPVERTRCRDHHRMHGPLHRRREGHRTSRGRRERQARKKVIISAPAKGEDITSVMGVNSDQYDGTIHHIISSASCTTNCLAPVVHPTFATRRKFWQFFGFFGPGSRINKGRWFRKCV
jgi:glyceraldehyde 3-phosphate dehydrogenase